MKFPAKIHWHPFSVHFASVFYPFAGFLLIIYLFTENRDIEKICNYSLWAATLTNLFAIVTGFVYWNLKYRSNLVSVFVQKIAISLVILQISALCLCWHWFQPDILTGSSTLSTGNVYKYIYIGLVFLIAPAIGHAGHLGGKLIHS